MSEQNKYPFSIKATEAENIQVFLGVGKNGARNTKCEVKMTSLENIICISLNKYLRIFFKSNETIFVSKVDVHPYYQYTYDQTIHDLAIIWVILSSIFGKIFL